MPADGRQPKAPPAGTVWTRDFGLLLAGTFLQGSAFYCLLPALPLFVAGPLSGSEQAVGLAVGIFSLTAVLVRPFGGFLLDRYGRRPWLLAAAGLFCACLFGYLGVAALSVRWLAGRWYDRSGPGPVMLTGLGVATVGWLAIGLIAHKAGLVGGGLLLGMGFGVAVPAFQTMTIDLVEPARRGAANATAFSAYDIGVALGAIGAGWLAAEASLEAIFITAGGLTLAAMLMFLFWVGPYFSRNRLRDIT